MTVNTRTRAITALALTGALLGGGALTTAPAWAAPIPPGCLETERERLGTELDRARRSLESDRAAAEAERE
ncbi:hypothetical protein ABZ634_11090, partial [Nocardiopsis alba]